VSDNRPDWTFTREVYEILHPKCVASPLRRLGRGSVRRLTPVARWGRYRRNLKRLYIVHPTWWVWFAITILNTFLISDVREKIVMVESLAVLYQHLPPSQVRVPDFVADYDRRYYGEALPATAPSPDTL
jgi:hypothetical protein